MGSDFRSRLRDEICVDSGLIGILGDCEAKGCRCEDGSGYGMFVEC